MARAWLLAALINDAEQSLQTSSGSQAKPSALFEELKRRLGNSAGGKVLGASHTSNLFKKDKARSSIAKARQIRQIVAKKGLF